MSVGLQVCVGVSESLCKNVQVAYAQAYEPISRSQSLQPAETQEQYRQQVGMAAGRHPEVEELVLQSFESCDSWRFSGQEAV